jgi:hypothetical protein
MIIKTKIIDATSFLEDADLSKLVDKSSFSNISDHLRYRLGKFWINDRASTYIPSDSSRKFLFDIKFNKDEILLIANKNYFSITKIENGILKSEYNPLDWKNFLINSDQFEYGYSPLFSLQENAKEIFYDHYFEIEKPIEVEKNIEKDRGSIKFYKKEFKYNFYSPKFESAISTRKIKESLLPSVYNMLEAISPSSQIVDKNTQAVLQITLGGQIESSLYTGIIENQNFKERKNLYHEKYAEILSEPETKLVIDALDNAGSLYDLSSYALSNAKSFSEDKFPFPFYSKIIFSCEDTKEFGNALKASNLFEKLKLDFQSYKNFYINYPFIVNDGSLSIEPLSIKLFDIKKWLEQLANYANGSATNSVRDEDRLLNYSSLITFLSSKIYKNFKSNIRDLEDIYDGKPAKSEILFYKIQKYEVNTKGDPIQEFYISNENTNIVEFLDTQIKYDKKYAYKVIACVIIFGNQYNFKNYYNDLQNDKLLDEDLQKGLYRVKYENNSSFKIAEIPMFEVDGLVVEGVSSSPNASITNNTLNKTKLKFSISKNLENTSKDPDIIEDRDYEYFKKLIINDKIEVLSKNKVSYLEIYKTDIKPKDYVDFSGRLLSTIPIDIGEYTFLDNITPETEYYYCFRYLNDHRNPSDISKVYRVILKNNGNEYYLDSEELLLEPIKSIEDHKQFKKLVLIKPNIKQTIISQDAVILQKLIDSNRVENIVLGISEQSVWSKRFKMRIKSIKTGKIIDFNFSFKRNTT